MLAAGIVVEQATQGPLDGPRQPRQRTGLLIAGDTARSITMEVTDGIPAPGRPAVLLFVRDDKYDQLSRAVTNGGQGQGARRARSRSPQHAIGNGGAHGVLH